MIRGQDNHDGIGIAFLQMDGGIADRQAGVAPERFRQDIFRLDHLAALCDGVVNIGARDNHCSIIGNKCRNPVDGHLKHAAVGGDFE